MAPDFRNFLTRLRVPRDASPDEDRRRLTPHERQHSDDLEDAPKTGLLFTRAHGTRNASIFGLIFSICVGGAFFAFGIYAKGFHQKFTLSPAIRHLTPLAVNVLIIAATEPLAFIHTTSLRWALFSENRLGFNTNSQFLSCTQRSKTLGPVWNAILFCCVAASYAGSGMIILQNPYDFYLDGSDAIVKKIKNDVSVSKAGPILIGIAILIQSTMSAWMIWTQWVPSWSSNPFNTAAIAMNKGYRLIREDGRCMMSVHDRHKIDMPTFPLLKQGSAYAARRAVRGVLYLAFAIFAALLVWTGVSIYLAQSTFNNSWSFVPTTSIDFSKVSQDQTFPGQTLALFVFSATTKDDERPGFVMERTAFVIALLFTLFQSFITMALHTIELQTNMYQDEQAWRKLMTPCGTVSNTNYNSLLATFTSWPSLTLFIAKPIIHWLFSSSLIVDYAQGVIIRVPQTVYLTAVWIALCAFILYVSLRKPAGPLPAAYGHLQTMVNIVDSWSERMFWGDKGETNAINRVRHAGTSSHALEHVHMDVIYGGSLCSADAAV